MSLLETIQHKIILESKIRKHLKTNPVKEFISINQADSIAILSDLRKDNVQPVLIDFFKKLNPDKKNIKLLLLIGENRDKINMYDYEKHFKGAEVFIVCPEDINLFQRPKNKSIYPFLAGDFDLVFRFDLEPNFTLDMALLSTKSKMYAGVNHPELGFLDFTISLNPNAGLNGLSNGMIQYLTHLNESQKNTKNTLF